MRLQLSAPWLAACLLLLLPARARADQISGTWSGEVEARGNYFLERSTRVIVPQLALALESPTGERVRAEYLVDVISSASIAQTGGEADGVFTELRHGVGLSTGKRWDVAEQKLDLSAFGVYSTEDDYLSLLYGLRARLSLDEENTTLGLGVTRVDDQVQSNLDPGFSRDLQGVSVAASVSQVVSKTVRLGFGYQLEYLAGFLGNAYRRALIGPLPYAERPPSERVRHNAEAQLSWHLPGSATTLQLYHRAYLDSWEIGALTPEVRVYQGIGPDLVARARYRYYAQTAASFYPRPIGAPPRLGYPRGYGGPLTNDPKLAALQTHQLGLQLQLRLSMLGGTFAAFAKDAWLDVSLDRQLCTSSYGDNYLVTAGGRLPWSL